MSAEFVPTNLASMVIENHRYPTEIQSVQDKIQVSMNKNPNVRVVCRIKPLGYGEEPIDMKIDKMTSEISIIQPRQETTKTFTFNRIFTDETQGEFVPEVCKRVLSSAFEHNQGYLIFSYGVTNSGKTHTILGSPNEPGILPYLVRKLSEVGEVQLSAIELYNDEFFSLVNREKLTPKEINGFLDFKNCAVSEIIDKENMENKLRLYLNNRTQNETKMNAKSSRSHAIFRLQTGNTIIGVVDLAGSERSNRVGTSFDESSNINKSLLCLGKCIKALGESSDTLPIPYRESKLTKVLIEYFAKKVEVLMIANINQSQSCFHENMKVLDYAVLAKDIQHCSSENSLKKSEFKFLKTNKVDVFEALYKSSHKVFQPHKSLKTSRNKNNEERLISAKSNTKAMETNKKFARALKAQQLQMYIEKFDSSNETFEHMVEYMRQKELEEDESKIENISVYNYHSPNVIEHKASITHGETREIGVGIEQKSEEQMKKEIAESMKEELKMLLEIERLASMKDQETFIGDSFKKRGNHSIEESQSNDQTPLKGKSVQPEESFLMKTSNQICSSVKKIISSNIQSFKKIVPKFLKSGTKENKLQICSYSDNFTDLFKPEIIHHERESIFSLLLNSEIGGEKVNFETQTSNHMENVYVPEIEEKEYSEGNDTTIESLNGSFSIENNEANLMIRNSKIIEDIKEESVDKEDENIGNKEEENENKDNDQSIENTTNPKNLGKKKKNKSKYNQDQAQKVNKIRKDAERLCREITPIKMRLRGHKH